MPFGQFGLTKLPILYRLEGEVPPAEQRFESMDIPVMAAGLESHKPQATRPRQGSHVAAGGPRAVAWPVAIATSVLQPCE